jgi:hypothetical protein
MRLSSWCALHGGHDCYSIAHMHARADLATAALDPQSINCMLATAAAAAAAAAAADMETP